MYVNVKMIPVETVPVIRGGGMKRAVERMNSSMIYLTHFKNLCKCYNEPQFSTTLNLCHEAPSENKKKTVVAILTSSTVDFFLFIYSHMHILFGSFLPSASPSLSLLLHSSLPGRTCSALVSNFVEEKT
jgi:hypothetical protein